MQAMTIEHVSSLANFNYFDRKKISIIYWTMLYNYYLLKYLHKKLLNWSQSWKNYTHEVFYWNLCNFIHFSINLCDNIIQSSPRERKLFILLKIIKSSPTMNFFLFKTSLVKKSCRECRLKAKEIIKWWMIAKLH